MLHRMHRRFFYHVIFALLSASFFCALPALAAPLQQGGFASPRFEQVWATTDRAVAEGRANRSWTWGPQPGLARTESYKQSPGGQRLVQYFDKARMEINDPANTSGVLSGVTSGLLVVEMVSGRVKLGDGIGSDENEQRQPAFELPVAGDWAGRLGATPGYVNFRSLATVDNEYRDPRRVGERVGTTFSSEGVGTIRTELAAINGTDIVSYNETTGHNVPRVFNDFMNVGPVPAIVAFGHPITDPYWIRAVVGGIERDILIQLFERRTLTYTPANPQQFQVEMGNVGQHYLYWRYGKDVALGGTK